jgi:hypothetical protein
MFERYGNMRIPHFERSVDANRLDKNSAVTAFQAEFRATIPTLLRGGRSATEIAKAILDHEQLSIDGWLAGYALQILVLENSVSHDLRGNESPGFASGWTLLHVAAAWGPDQFLDMLLETASPTQLNLRDTMKNTILHNLVQRLCGAWDPLDVKNLPRLATKMLSKGVLKRLKSQTLAGNNTALQDVEEHVAMMSQPELESMGMWETSQELIRVLRG